jgi:hypothetical protein
MQQRIDDYSGERHFPPEACSQCHDTGRVLVFAYDDNPHKDVIAIWPCPYCAVPLEETLSRFLGLPVWLVLTTIWLAGAVLLAEAAYALLFFVSTVI